jgi:hypothetical protein
MGTLDTKTFVVRDAVAAAYKSEKMRFKNSGKIKHVDLKEY